MKTVFTLLPRSQKGFTLVELLMSMALLSLLLVSLTGIFASTIEARLKSEATSAKQQDAQYILTRLFYDINQASAITSPSTISSSQSSLSLTINSQTWTYSLSNGDLILTNPSGIYQMNSHLTTVTGFTVTRIGNSTGKASIQVALTTASRISGAAGNGSLSYTTTYSKW